jgi:hypothetical protein
MGLPFPVYPLQERPTDDQGKAALKAAIWSTFQNDRDVNDLLQPILDDLRTLLHGKTGHVVAALKRRE